MQTQDTAPTKQCKACGGTFSLLMFYKQHGMRDGRRSYCKKCDGTRYKNWVAENPRNQNGVNGKQKIGDFSRYIRGQVPCALCGESDAVCLDFHHVDPREKTKSVGKCSTMQAFVEEVVKCVVICANCHRRVHARMTVIDNLKPLDPAMLDEMLSAFCRHLVLREPLDT
jgi:hypothetical protein